MWSNNKNLTEALKDSAERSGEKMWHMPLCEESYGEQIKSKIADLKNIGGKGGGSITAALFLKEFVNKSAWAHLDIAGPVWSDKVGLLCLCVCVSVCEANMYKYKENRMCMQSLSCKHELVRMNMHVRPTRVCTCMEGRTRH
jgi:hypothetical protein